MYIATRATPEYNISTRNSQLQISLYTENVHTGNFCCSKSLSMQHCHIAELKHNTLCKMRDVGIRNMLAIMYQSKFFRLIVHKNVQLTSLWWTFLRQMVRPVPRPDQDEPQNLHPVNNIQFNNVSTCMCTLAVAFSHAYTLGIFICRKQTTNIISLTSSEPTF